MRPRRLLGRRVELLSALAVNAFGTVGAAAHAFLGAQKRGLNGISDDLRFAPAQCLNDIAVVWVSDLGFLPAGGQTDPENERAFKQMLLLKKNNNPPVSADLCDAHVKLKIEGEEGI